MRRDQHAHPGGVDEARVPEVDRDADAFRDEGCEVARELVRGVGLVLAAQRDHRAVALDVHGHARCRHGASFGRGAESLPLGLNARPARRDTVPT